MSMLFSLYATGLLVGIVVGFVFPTLFSPWFILSCVLGIIVTTELVGWLGFGNRWYDYRTAIYPTYPAMAGCALLGFLLGSGKVGTFLVAAGTVISR